MSASNTVQNALNNALLYTRALQRGHVPRATWPDSGRRASARQRFDRAETIGIVIDQCEVQSIPPRHIADVFTPRYDRPENRNKILNDARSYENQVLSQAGARPHPSPMPPRRPPAMSNPSPPRRSAQCLLPKYEVIQVCSRK